MPQGIGQNGMEIDNRLEATIRFNNRYLNIRVPTMSQMAVMTRYLMGTDICEKFQELESRRPIRTILDIGANIGLLSILFAAAFPNAEIYAMEPSPTNCEYIKHNCKEFPSITLIEKGAYSKAGYAQLACPDQEQRAIPEWNMNTGQLSLYGRGENKEIVELARIDDLFEDVDFIKLDVEGAELDVLVGAERLMAESKPILLIEIRDDILSMAGRSSPDVTRHLDKIGYVPIGVFESDLIFMHREMKC